jgi:hypothetical protein
MESIFDWITVLVFCGLAVLYLQRSASPEPKDNIWHYPPPAVGLMAVNYLGDEGYAIPAVALLVAVLAYIYYVLKPLSRPE